MAFLLVLMWFGLQSLGLGVMGASLWFEPAEVWEGGATNIYCASNSSALADVSQLSFYSLDSDTGTGTGTGIGTHALYFNLTRNCDSGEFNVTADTSGGRIGVPDDQSGNVTLLWNAVTGNESGVYSCSLSACWFDADADPEEAEEAILTVYLFNGMPELVQPEEDSITVFENMEVQVNFTCTGFAGFPPGVIWLSQNETTLEGAVSIVNETMELDDAGYSNGSISKEMVYQRSVRNFYQCVSAPSFTIDVLPHVKYSERKFDVIVHYSPDELSLVPADDRLPFFDDGDGSYRLFINSSSSQTVSCACDGNPRPTFSFYQMNAPFGFAIFSQDYTQVLISVPAHEHKPFRIELRCDTFYNSSFYPQFAANLTGILTVYINQDYTPPEQAPTTPNSSTLTYLSNSLNTLCLLVLLLRINL